MSGSPERAAALVGSTLRRRLGFALGGRLLLAWALTTLAVSVAVVHDLDELYDASLLSTAAAIEALDAAPSASGAGWRDVPLAVAAGSPIVHRLRDRAGNAAAPPRANASVDAWRAPIARRGGERAVEIEIGAHGQAGAAHVVEIAQRLEDRRAAILDVLAAMLLPALLIVPVGLLGLRTTLARELAPLSALADEIDRRHAADLSPVSAAGMPGELDPVVRGLDRLLLRLRRALDAERDFAATTAHELRTPLAGAIAQTQRLLVETDGPPRLRAGRIERSLHRLQRLATRLLELSRAEGAATTLERAVDLAPALERTVALLAESGDAHARLVVDAGGGGALHSHLDPDLFSVLLGNLVENALAHGAPGERVTVRRRGRCIEVDNAGVVLERRERPRLAQRFARGGNGGGGAGLGLAIVQAIADGSGVRVELLSPVPGRADGVRARVTLEPASSLAAA